MKVIDNFKLIRKMIEERPCNEDQFYFVQVLVRGKDGHLGEAGINGNNKNRMTKFYTIRNVDELDKYENEMKGIADLVNGRVYIHPARRSFKGVANEMMKEFVTMYTQESYHTLKSAYSTACGKIRGEKVYIVDIDNIEMNTENVNHYIDIILDCSENRDPARILSVIPTLHGFHILAKPFNTKKYAETIGEKIDECVKKNNPTLLYYKSIND